jgi:shikimate dehydrogenase
MANASGLEIYGVVGFPAKHSLSPLTHNAAFRHLKLPADYKIFEIKPQEFEVFIRNLPKKGISGVNITVPYKEAVLPYLHKAAEGVSIIGAVNTVKVSRENGALEGFNTDADGFMRHLREELGVDPQHKRVALLGCGGAGKAVAVALAREKPRSITVFDTDACRAEFLAKHLMQHFRDIAVTAADSVKGLKIKEADILINATPVGMKKDDPLLVEVQEIHPGLFVYDVIYNPAETALLKCALKMGAKVSNGLGMLLYQGARSFELWTGKEAPLAVMRQALYEGVRKL